MQQIYFSNKSSQDSSRVWSSQQLPTKSSDDEVIISKVQDRTTPREKRPHLVLSRKENAEIMGGGQLCDESINIAQNLLAEQYPLLKGFENTTLGPLREFSVFDGPFVQILHNGKNHWICCTNLNPNDWRVGKCDEVWCYDSLYSGVTKSTKKQIAQFLNIEGEELKIHICPVQQQTGGTDCGAFAIAFATSLAGHENPSVINYKQNQLRRHLLACFKEGKMKKFPKNDEGSVSRCRIMTHCVKLFCHCKMPLDNKSIALGERMVKCTICKNPYHQICEKIPENIFRKNDSNWCCSLCK